MENPFRYGDVVGEPYFTNRASELTELKADIRAGQNVILISPRRFGKTSLVTRAMLDLRRQGILLAYVDLLEAPNKERLVALLAQAMYRDLATRVVQAKQKALEVMRNVHPGLHFSVTEGGGSWAFSPTLGTRDVDNALAAILRFPEKIAHERKKRTVLVLDEFQSCIDIDPDLPGVMRAIFQHQSDVSHVFLGSRQHLMRTVFADKGQPMYRIGKVFTLHPIARSDWSTYLSNRCLSTKVAIDKAATATLLDLTECLPYETQQVAYFAWNLAIARTRRIDESVVWDAWKQVVDGESTRYVDAWQSLSGTGRALLQAVANGVLTRLHSRDVALKWQLGSSSAVGRAIATLIEAELLEEHVEHARRPHEKQYRITDPVFREWLRALSLSPIPLEE